MCKTCYDAIVVGLGPSGMMATLTLRKKGYNVIAFDRGKSFQDRDEQIPFDVANGLGGAGLFSDGKLSFFPAASNLWANLKKEDLKRSYIELIEHFSNIGFHLPRWQNNWAVKRKEKSYTKKTKRYKTLYFEKDACLRFIDYAYNQIKDCVLLNSEVGSIVKISNGEYSVCVKNHSQKIYYAKRIILATGKVGNSIFDSVSGIKIDKHCRYEAGVRVETNSSNFKPCDLKQIDYKYIERFSDDTEFRTFCCCKDGQVLESDYSTNASFNGSIMPHHTGRSNIGLTVRVENQSHPFAQEIISCIQRREKYIIPFDLKHDPSKEFFFGPVLDDVILKRMDVVLKHRDHRFKTKIYGPEIEYYGMYADFIWDTLKISNENIWIVGDLSAKYRGIISALISGIYAAHQVSP